MDNNPVLKLDETFLNVSENSDKLIVGELYQIYWRNGWGELIFLNIGLYLGKNQEYFLLLDKSEQDRYSGHWSRIHVKLIKYEDIE